MDASIVVSDLAAFKVLRASLEDGKSYTYGFGQAQELVPFGLRTKIPRDAPPPRRGPIQTSDRKARLARGRRAPCVYPPIALQLRTRFMNSNTRGLLKCAICCLADSGQFA